MLPTILKNPALPRSLRELPRWFVTFAPEVRFPGRVPTANYSALTLQTLRWDEPSDFTTFERAARTAEDHALVNGVALKITKPYVAVIIQNCIGPEGRVPRWLRIAAKRIGGYWEIRQNWKDVVGI